MTERVDFTKEEVIDSVNVIKTAAPDIQVLEAVKQRSGDRRGVRVRSRILIKDYAERLNELVATGYNGRVYFPKNIRKRYENLKKSQMAKATKAQTTQETQVAQIDEQSQTQ